MRLLVSTGVLALTSMASGQAYAQEAVVNACSGVSLPRSVVTGIVGDVVTPVVTPLQNILGTLTLGTVNLGLAQALTNAANGAPINLGVVDVNGNTVNVLATPQCVTQASAYTLTTPAGLALGGGRITGLGTSGLYANAAETDAIAFGNSANTGAGATGAVAIGTGASVTATGALGSVALGQNSLATGTTLGNAAYLVGGTAAAEVNIGDRRLTGLAAGSSDTDAVNVAQLKAAALGVAGDALNYDAGLGAYSALRAGVTTKITNVAPATLSATSTDAVNGAQLSATNDAVTANTTNITNIGTSVGSLQANALLFNPAINAFDASRGGAPSTITNVAPAALNATSTDAVNGAQLSATNDAVTANTTNITNIGTSVGSLQANALLFNPAINAFDASRGGAPSTITNVAAAGLNATSTDAVNGSQLYATNQTVANLSTSITSGTADPLAVRYTDATKATLALGGATGTVVTNLAAGAVSATSTDAVNGAQLSATNDAVATNTTNITNIGTSVGALQSNALLFDPTINAFNASRGGAPSTITNVAAAGLNATSTDAVNGAQLYATNQTVANLSTSITNGTADPLAVRYTDATKGTLALGGATGTVVTNVAAGAVSTTSTDAVNGSQLATTNQSVTNLGTSVASSLGGGSVVNANGSVSAPTYQLTTVAAGGASTTSTYTDVGSALSGLGNSIANVNTRIDTINAVSDRAVTYDGATGAPRDTITLAGTTGTRISNLTAGAVNATSTDAVDGAQLYAVGQQVAANTTSITNLTTNVTSLQNGTAGFFQVNNSAGNPTPVASGTNAVAGGGGAAAAGASAVALGAAASASAANSVALGAGSVADRANSVSVGTATATRQITNVAAGVSPTDAVNLGQLNSGLNQTLAQANSYTDARLAQVGFDIRDVRRDANGGTAAAMALATIPQAYGPGMGMVGGGISTWGGEEAFAIGVSKATASGGVVVKAGATINTRGQGGGAAGVGFAF